MDADGLMFKKIGAQADRATAGTTVPTSITAPADAGPNPVLKIVTIEPEKNFLQ